MTGYDAAIVKCSTYSMDVVSCALKQSLDAINGLDFVLPGMTVVVKPNLVSYKKPDAAATTHPVLLHALCEMILDKGAKVIIGDSPGGPHSLSLLNAVYSATGMTQLERLGVTLNRNMAQSTAEFPKGKVLRQFQYTSYLSKADAIIDFCKLKAHGMVGMSAAVKNMFGAVPGLVKPEMHYRFPNLADFADMLIDLYEYFTPRLCITDAIIGMEGNGPTAGNPKHIGAVIASKSAYHADLIGATLIRLKPEGVPTIKAAIERGLSHRSLSELKIYGDVNSFIVPDFEAAPVRTLKFMNSKSLFGKLAAACLTQRPTLKAKLCVNCAECQRMCPANAITMQNGLPVIDAQKCIRCFCCQEFCPKAAMQVHRTLVAKLLNRFN